MKKELINEHDMTKKMMDIMRGGYKPLIKEEMEEQQEEVVQSTGAAKPPREGRASLLQLDSTYFEMDKNDDRFKDFVNNLHGIVPSATVTSIYISPDGGLVINGFALKFSQNSGLFFTMSLSEDSILVSSENVQGKLGTEVQNNLQKFLDNLRADAIGTKQYQYDEKIDKEANNANQQG